MTSLPTGESRCHLIVLATDLGAVLTSHIGPCWLAPSITHGRADRTGDLASARTSALVDGPFDIVHHADLEEANHVTGNGADSYCAFIARGSARAERRLSWTTLDAVHRSKAVWRWQADALETCLARLHSPVAPFDCPQVGEAITGWVEEQLRERQCKIMDLRRWYRCSRYDRVVSIRTTAGRVFFKGGPRRANEAQLTLLFESIAPAHTPPTIAFDKARGWWLTDDVRGSLLSSVRPLSPGVVQSVVCTLVRMQKLSCEFGPMREHLALAPHAALDLFRHAAGLLRDVNPSDSVVASELSRVIEILEESSIQTWVHSDLALMNILLASGQVYVLDHEQPLWGHPALILGRMLGDLTSHPDGGAKLAECAVDEFVNEWIDRLPERELRRVIEVLPTTRRLLALIRRLDKESDQTNPAAIRERASAVARQIRTWALRSHSMGRGADPLRRG